MHRTVHRTRGDGNKPPMRPTFPALLCTLVFSGHAFAQSPDVPAPGTDPAGAATSPVALPPPPTIDDPMLAPMLAAPKNLSTWEEALDLIRARSTDLRKAYDEVLYAAGQTRSALAATLPTIALTGTYSFQTGNYPVLNITPGLPCANSSAACVSTAPNANSVAAQGVVTQPLIAFEAWHQIGTARKNERAKELTFDDMKRTIAL